MESDGVNKIVVITGSTRGIGLGLACEFLKRECSVVISSRTPDAVTQTVSALAQEYDAARVFGCACDVAHYDQVQTLWDAAHQHFGRIDIWINNAGIGHPDIPFWELPHAQAAQVVDINLTGTLYGTHVALNGMRAQGGGFIYMMEGFGSTGRTREGMSVYGSTKAAVHYFARALLKDTANSDVKIGSLSPGMVVTDFVSDQYKGREEEYQRAKDAFNLFGDRVETVTPWLVENMLKNDRTGARFQWLTQSKFFGRLFMSRFKKRDLFRDASAYDS